YWPDGFTALQCLWDCGGQSAVGPSTAEALQRMLAYRLAKHEYTHAFTLDWTPAKDLAKFWLVMSYKGLSVLLGEDEYVPIRLSSGAETTARDTGLSLLMGDP